MLAQILAPRHLPLAAKTLQDVTLGGTGKETGDRHPKIEANVLIGASAKVLGNITIGKVCLLVAVAVVLIQHSRVPATGRVLTTLLTQRKACVLVMLRGR